MKKFSLSLILIFLAYFFTIIPSYCEEDFFINGEFSEAKNKKLTPISNISKSFENSKKDGFLSKFKRNKEEESAQKGYYGILPDIGKDFKYKRQQAQTTTKNDLKTVEESEIKEENLKKAPFDDSLFLDMVIKKEPTSEYVNDIQKVKFALKNLKDCLENESDIQRFNACVNSLELYVQNLKRKYENKSESLKESYIDLLNTNYYAKTLGNLKYDANYYARFVPTQDSKYSKENISHEEQKLLNRVNRTLLLLNNEA